MPLLAKPKGAVRRYVNAERYGYNKYIGIYISRYYELDLWYCMVWFYRKYDMKKTTFKAVKDRDIETVLWDLVEDSLREFNVSRNCKIGRQTFSNILSTLSQMEMLKRRREDKNIDKQLEMEEYNMKEWLTVLEGNKK